MRLLLDAARGARELLPDVPSWRWGVVLALALAVTFLEAIGAGLVLVLVGLTSSGAAPIELPLVGDLASRFPGVAVRDLQIWAALMLAAFFVVRGAVYVAQEYVQARITQDAGAELATRLVRGYLGMPYLFHTKRNSAELVRNAYSAARQFVGGVLMPLVRITAETTLVVGLTGVLLVVSPTATLLAMVVLGPVLVLLMGVVQPRLKVLGGRAHRAQRDSLQSLQQALGGFRDIRLLGREDAFTDRFRRHRSELARAEHLRAALEALPRVMIEVALIAVIVAVLILALLRGGRVEGVLSTLGVFAYVGLRLQPSLRIIASGMNALRYGSVVVEDLLADFRRIEAWRPSGSATARELPLRAAIVLDDVSFRYEDGGPHALEHVTMRIARGEFVGICGPTGGGKSTVIDILTGLLSPTSGECRIDDVVLAGNEAAWQSQLGVVSQSVYLIDDTLRANIALGYRGAEIDEVALRRAVQQAQLDEVVAGLPGGLNTIVGERGIRLSGGQRQRVAIARALYRDPEVIVFDEGTSALDRVTEEAVVEALRELQASRTLVAVAHRVATLRSADRIYVVADGTVGAAGTYDELMHEDALFRSLAQ